MSKCESLSEINCAGEMAQIERNENSEKSACTFAGDFRDIMGVCRNLRAKFKRNGNVDLYDRIVENDCSFGYSGDWNCHL